jgi:hypothetical protein
VSEYVVKNCVLHGLRHIPFLSFEGSTLRVGS